MNKYIVLVIVTVQVIISSTVIYKQKNMLLEAGKSINEDIVLLERAAIIITRQKGTIEYLREEMDFLMDNQCTTDGSESKWIPSQI